MGTVHAEIELINEVDKLNARNFKIGEEEVRRMRVTMLVDTGACEMCINENIRSYLGLDVLEHRWVELADGRWIEVDIVGPIEVRFANRSATVRAYVLPGDSEPLLGAVPMESMDVLVHPARQELVVNPEYPDFAYGRI